MEKITPTSTAIEAGGSGHINFDASNNTAFRPPVTTETSNPDGPPIDLDDLDAELLESLDDDDTEKTPAEQLNANSDILDDPNLLTDFGNAAHFLNQFRRITRYIEARDKFLTYYRGRWTDEQARVEQNASRVIKSLKSAYQPADNAERLAQFKWYLASQKPERRKAMLTIARSEIAAKYDDFDADPELLNVANGAVELSTGRLLAHAPELLCTKISPVKFVPGATCPRWVKFLEEIFEDDQELISFIQRAVGYSLSAHTREQVFFLLYGVGKNGKSVFLNIIKAIAGEYGQTAQMSVFTQKHNASAGHNEEVANLRGARLLTAEETEESKRLAEGLIKQITGGSPITASRKHEHAITFTPQFKLWLAANHKPVIRGTDEGIWRRPLLIPFNVQFELDTDKAKQPGKRAADKKLESVLLAELPGILNWAIQGYQKWEQFGLPRPEKVRAATEAYRAESDLLGTYLEERTIQGPRHSVNATDLYKDYCLWCDESNEHPVKQRTFGDSLVERGFQKRKSTFVTYEGIGLLASQNQG